MFNIFYLLLATYRIASVALKLLSNCSQMLGIDISYSSSNYDQQEIDDTTHIKIVFMKNLLRIIFCGILISFPFICKEQKNAVS